MSATVEVYLDNRPDGSEVRVPGLGVFKNGTTTEVDEDVWRRFRAANPEYGEDHTFEFSTEAYEERQEALERVQQEENLEDLKKDELEEVAEQVGVNVTSDMTKSDIVEELE